MIKKWLFCFILFFPGFAAGVIEDNAALPDGVERQYFIYYFDNPRYINEADKILERVRAQLVSFLNDSLAYKPAVYLVAEQGLFEELISGRFPDWGAAAALPARQMIVIKSPDQFNLGRPLEELLTHEYAHLALHNRTGVNIPPRWFDEGLAMVVSREWSWSDNLALSRAAVFGRLLTLEEIELLNRFNSSKAHLAYAQSYLAVKYFFEAYDRTAVNIFLDNIARGFSVDSALLASTGSNYKGFQDEFNIYLTRRFNVASLFMDTIYLWIFLALVVIVGAILKFRKRKEYYKKWEREEKYQSTDFDYGDPAHPEHDNDDEPWRN
ncbi:MAG: peptidase MA family metallohydrolase [candidate division Zixibacteria bacterium]|nr:peptidase MA family metallohydrolase [candidate division Zixibacteria bacterium]MDD5426336.1 peptidase MA family metallohydrolase [candidate division Zixibacteria bacterium]